MKSLGLSFLIFMAMCSNAYAQALVRSGEHDTFSRLVVYVPDSQSWELTRSDSGFRLTLENWTRGFDTSSIFERIPQTRVSSVEARESQLELNLNCDCVAIAERVPGVGIIVDISEGPALSEPVPTEAIASPAPELFEGLRDAPALNLTQLPEEDPVNPALDAFRKSLFEGLGRSATLSLVEIDETEKDRDIEGIARSRARDLGVTVDDGRVRVTTALESALNSNRSRITATRQKQCPPSEYFAIHNWGTGDDLGFQLANLRRNLLGEFDTVDFSKVQQLARLYLYFGMGSEARVLMKQFEAPPSQKNIVVSLANILEPQLFGSEEIPLDIVGCGAETVPWSVLLRADGDAVTEKEAIETTAQFSRWPRHLQEMLGPRFISVLSSSGRSESVEVLKNILSRQGEELPQAAELAAEKHSLPSSESLATLLEITKSGSDQSAEALVLYLQKSLQEGAFFDQELIELASAYADEMDGTDLSLELTSLKIEALAAKGRVLESLEAFNRAKATGWTADDNLGDKLASHVLGLEDPQLIAQLSVFITASDNEISISDLNQEKLIQVLLDIGLPVLAGRIYQPKPTQEEPTRIAAELAIASGAIEQAVELLNDVGDPDADQRRADVLLRSGRAVEAWQTRSSNTPEEQAVRLAWFAQQWESVGTSGAEGQVASLIVKEPESDFQTSPLASARELSQDSSKTRSAVRDLLQSSGF